MVSFEDVFEDPINQFFENPPSEYQPRPSQARAPATHDQGERFTPNASRARRTSDNAEKFSLSRKGFEGRNMSIIC
jgi:hypothetical protein